MPTFEDLRVRVTRYKVWSFLMLEMVFLSAGAVAAALLLTITEIRSGVVLSAMGTLLAVTYIVHRMLDELDTKNGGGIER